jgi:hypothetical protein
MRIRISTGLLQLVKTAFNTLPASCLALHRMPRKIFEQKNPYFAIQFLVFYTVPKHFIRYETRYFTCNISTVNREKCWVPLLEIKLVFVCVSLLGWTPCWLVDTYQRFEGIYGLHLQVFSPEASGNMFLRNAGIYLQVYTALQPKKCNIDIFTTVRTSSLIKLIDRPRYL